MCVCVCVWGGGGWGVGGGTERRHAFLYNLQMRQYFLVKNEYIFSFQFGNCLDLFSTRSGRRNCSSCIWNASFQFIK